MECIRPGGQHLQHLLYHWSVYIRLSKGCYYYCESFSCFHQWTLKLLKLGKQYDASGASSRHQSVFLNNTLHLARCETWGFHGRVGENCYNGLLQHVDWYIITSVLEELGAFSFRIPVVTEDLNFHLSRYMQKQSVTSDLNKNWNVFESCYENTNPALSHPLWFNLPNNIKWTAQMIRFTLRYTFFTSLLLCIIPIPHPYKTTDQITVSGTCLLFLCKVSAPVHN
jgi:hypothetical protein